MTDVPKTLRSLKRFGRLTEICGIRFQVCQTRSTVSLSVTEVKEFTSPKSDVRFAAMATPEGRD